MTQVNTDLLTTVTTLEQEQFTGKLQVNGTSQKQWKLFFYLGQLIWADGGSHSNRSWRRLLNKYCNNIDLKQQKINAKEQFEAPNYQILTVLLEQQLIDTKSAQALVVDRLNEIIFEIAEHQARETLSYKNCNISDRGLSLLKVAPVLVEAKLVTTASQQKWALWTQKGLASYSPNLAPTIAEPEQLRQSVNEVVYKNFAKLLNGNNTLYDLALQMKSEPIKLISSLLQYIDRGSIQLIEIGDIKPPISIVQPSVPKSARNQEQPLIACIDDSLQIGLIMEQIITKAGYRCISIQQPLQAIPQLIANPPALIFLDVRMPIINGYELCSQIRRISQLQTIPIVMLTGQDGIVDRMRAKVVGAYDFMSKPIDDQKVIKIVEKFLFEFNAPILP